MGRPGIDLYWLPLGAGGHSVRLNGLVFEAVAATIGRRRRCDLYHSALEVHVPEGRFVIEMTPARPGDGADVVAEGAVGARAAGRLRLFRYEVRRWRDGRIPDVAEAIGSPLRLSDDPDRARSLLALVPEADGRLGQGRARRRGDVELELPRVVVDRTQWARRRGGRPSDRRPRPGLASRHRRRRAPAASAP